MGHQDRIVFLGTRNTELAAINDTLAERITDHDTRSVFLIRRNEVLSAQRGGFEADIETLLVTGCEDESEADAFTLSFLHSDHLGRPQFATNDNGDVTWDGGITTPFGLQVTALAAQTQALMFPGQYQDLETTGAGVTLSHNWHRTYDPMLGRYLQADPIGLAGGLNRYAYVGGNPVGFVDPTGLDMRFIETEKGPDSTTGHLGAVIQDGQGNCYRVDFSRAESASNLVGSLMLVMGLDVPGSIFLSSTPCEDSEGAPFLLLTPEQDERIFQCAKEELINPPGYNLRKNNCTDSVQGLLKCAGVPALGPSVTAPFAPATPNGSFDAIVGQPNVIKP